LSESATESGKSDIKTAVVPGDVLTIRVAPAVQSARSAALCTT
jgi:hypothetical protein